MAVPFTMRLRTGNTTSCELLLEAGANPNAGLDSTGCCLSVLVDYRTLENHPAREAYDLLIKHGAVDLDLLDFDTHPQEIVEEVFPVHWIEDITTVEKWAKNYGTDRLKDLWWGLGPHGRADRKTMEALIGYGHDINRADWWGRTLLQADAAEGDLDRVKMLIDLGADPQWIDVQSRTNALGYAARQGRVEMVKFLLEQGVDKNPDVPDWGKPLRYAQDYLADHAVRFNEREHGQSRLNGHRTNEPTSSYEEIIQLLS